MSKDKKASDQRYKGNGKHEWEFSALNTYRLRVPGGWLYRYEVPGQAIAQAGGRSEWGRLDINAPSVAITTDGLIAMQLVPMPEVVKHKV